MRFGISVPAQPPFEIAKMIAGVAEPVGFDSLWLWDHLLGLWHPEAHAAMPLAEVIPVGDAFFDPYVFATALGAHWNGPIGTAVTCTTRRHPVVTAQCALSAQNFLPSGEFILGIGSGEAEGTVPFGYNYSTPVGRFEEAIQIIRHFLDTDEPLHFSGKHFNIDGGRMGLRPPAGKPRPQIWIGAHGPRMLDITGRLGDGWLPAFPQTPDEYAERVARIERTAQEVGRPRPVMGAMFFPIIGESAEKVMYDMNKNPLLKSIGLMLSDDWLQKHAGVKHPEPGSRGIVDTVPHRYSIEAVKEFGSRVDANGFYDGGWPVGNADDLTRFLQSYKDAGCDYVVCFDTTAALYGAAALEGAIGTYAKVIGALKS